MINLRNNFNKLKTYENFLIEHYKPSDALIKAINNAFKHFNKLDTIDEYLLRKHENILNPSLEDKMLILFSKDKECPVVSNDLDLTFFRKELVDLNLCYEIIDFKTIT